MQVFTKEVKEYLDNLCDSDETRLLMIRAMMIGAGRILRRMKAHVSVPPSFENDWLLVERWQQPWMMPKYSEVSLDPASLRFAHELTSGRW